MCIAKSGTEYLAHNARIIDIMAIPQWASNVSNKANPRQGSSSGTVSKNRKQRLSEAGTCS